MLRWTRQGEKWGSEVTAFLHNKWGAGGQPALPLRSIGYEWDSVH